MHRYLIPTLILIVAAVAVTIPVFAQQQTITIDFEKPPRYDVEPPRDKYEPVKVPIGLCANAEEICDARTVCRYGLAKQMRQGAELFIDSFPSRPGRIVPAALSCNSRHAKLMSAYATRVMNQLAEECPTVSVAYWCKVMKNESLGHCPWRKGEELPPKRPECLPIPGERE